MLFGALLGGATGLVVVEISVSQVFSEFLQRWRAQYLQQFLSHPLVFPIWLGLLVSLGFYLGGRLALWFTRERHNARNQEV